MNVSEVLRDAADLLEHKGWVQHTLYRDSYLASRKLPAVALFTPSNTDDVGYCITGAIRTLTAGDPHNWNDDAREAIAFVADRIGRATGFGPAEDLVTNNDVVTGWNDIPGRTKQEVLDLLREAANND